MDAKHRPQDSADIVSFYQSRLRLYHGLTWFLWILAGALLIIALLYRSDLLMAGAAGLLLSKWLVLDLLCHSLFKCPSCKLPIGRVGMPWQNIGTLDVLSCPHCQVSLSHELIEEQESSH